MSSRIGLFRQRSVAVACSLLLAPASTEAQRADEAESADTLALTKPVAPRGFSVEVYAADLGAPAGMVFGSSGELLVSDARGGRILRLAGAGSQGRAGSVSVLLEGLDYPTGMVRRGAELWVAEATRLINIQLSAAPGTPPRSSTLIAGLPLGADRSHALAVDPTDRFVFLSVGAACEVCLEDDERRATIMRISVDDRRSGVWASGLRKVGGLAFHPRTWELWATDAGRDSLGLRLPPDELNVIERGARYGWPFCYGMRVPDPVYNSTARCDATTPPALLFEAGSGPGGLTFYTGDMFPAQYSGDAIVALSGALPGRAEKWHGATQPVYKVIRIRYEAGQPRDIEDFLTGWAAPDGRVIGRPVQPLVGPDGALYVSDDHGGRIWRVTYGALNRGEPTSGTKAANDKGLEPQR